MFVGSSLPLYHRCYVILTLCAINITLVLKLCYLFLTTKTSGTVTAMCVLLASSLMADERGWAPGGPATLFILGVLHLGLFFFATSDEQATLAPALGLWILGISVPLIILGIIEMRRGEALFGTMGMVFGGLLGLGAGLSFIRGLIVPGQSVMDGYWFAGTSVVFFLLVPSMLRISKLVTAGLVIIGAALMLLGLSLAGAFGNEAAPLTVAGYLALAFSLICYYAAAAQMTNAAYGRRVLPL